MFQIRDEVRAPTGTQYPEDKEVEDLVQKESLTLVLMFVRVLAGFCIYVGLLIMTPNILLLSGDYSKSASQDAQRDAVRNMSFQVRETRL